MASKWLESLTQVELAALKHDWAFWARPEQLPPEDEWRIWLVLAGRGFGKTRTGAEWVRSQKNAGKGRIALVAPTAADARDVMIEGESGILAVSPPWDRPKFESSKRRIVWDNGAVATYYSAEDPDQLRGPQHDAAWGDELCAWPKMQATWDMLQFGLRLGADPRQIITTTPRPVKLLKELVARRDVALTRGKTLDNAANLSKQFIAAVHERYAGTRLGRQELDAEILTDVAGALWKREQIDDRRVNDHPDLIRVVVSVDPPASSGEKADECGITVQGVDGFGHGYVLADLSEQGLTPSQWAAKAVRAFETYKADVIVAEANNGGEMVKAVLNQVDSNVPIKLVHASRGKVTRAEPVSALYEQGRVSHVGSHPKLEDQMCEFTPDFDKTKAGYSPDRVDALVWGFTELMLKKTREFNIS